MAKPSTSPHPSSAALAERARSALASVESLTTDLSSKVTLCREAWHDYGQALLEQRRLTPADVEFGRWVKANGLDQGLAADSAVRSNAQWMAANWEGLQRCKPTNHHPTSLRQECRDAGHQWAFDQRPEKSKRDPWLNPFHEPRRRRELQAQFKPKLTIEQTTSLDRLFSSLREVHRRSEALRLRGIVQAKLVEDMRDQLAQASAVVEALAAQAIPDADAEATSEAADAKVEEVIEAEKAEGKEARDVERARRDAEIAEQRRRYGPRTAAS